MVFDGEKIEAEIVLVVPVNYTDTGPAAADGSFDQLTPHTGVCGYASAPNELLLFSLEGEARYDRAVGCDVAVVDSCNASSYFVIRSDLDLRPGPVSEIRHQPDRVILVTFGVRPDGTSSCRVGGEVLRRKDEFYAREQMTVWKGRQRTLERVESRTGPGSSNRHRGKIKNIQLHSQMKSESKVSL